EVAKGRIWSGEDAKELHLVDELGGMETALRLVREALKLADDAPLRVRRFPARPSTLELLLSGNETEAAARAAMTGAVGAVQPAVRLVRDLAGMVDTGPLTMPPAALRGGE